MVINLNPLGGGWADLPSPGAPPADESVVDFSVFMAALVPAVQPPSPPMLPMLPPDVVMPAQTPVTQGDVTVETIGAATAAPIAVMPTVLPVVLPVVSTPAALADVDAPSQVHAAPAPADDTVVSDEGIVPAAVPLRVLTTAPVPAADEPAAAPKSSSQLPTASPMTPEPAITPDPQRSATTAITTEPRVAPPPRPATPTFDASADQPPVQTDAASLRPTTTPTTPRVDAVATESHVVNAAVAPLMPRTPPTAVVAPSTKHREPADDVLTRPSTSSESGSSSTGGHTVPAEDVPVLPATSQAPASVPAHVSAPPQASTSAAVPAAAPAMSPLLAPLQDGPLTEQQAVMARLVETMRWQARAGGGTAELRLKPEALGAVTVSLVVERGVVKATLTADTPTAVEYLRNESNALQGALEERGLTLEEFEVRESTPWLDLREGQREKREQPQEQPHRPTRRVSGAGPQFAEVFDVIA